MCGVLAIFEPATISRQRAAHALGLMRHRGPDAQALWISDDDRIALGHARLKIIDLSESANQPMFSPDGRYGLVFNGEIVNFEAIRRAYRGDWQFQTRGDSEVLLARLAQSGLGALDDCVGMFAFVLHDAGSNSIVVARDRFGIKPLYWTRLRGGGIAFASEIPPLLDLSGQARPDNSTIRTYLETGLYDHTSRTFFDGVFSLEPGCSATLELSTGHLKISRWYDLASRSRDYSSRSRSDLMEEGRELIASAVREHLVSDVAVGLNVSGGVDSSVLTRVAKATLPDLHVFTQDYVGPYSELPWVERAVAGARLHATQLGSDAILEQLADTVRSEAEPFGGVTVIGYSALYREAAARGITVLLDGNGVDEVFLGYTKYLKIGEGQFSNDAGIAIDGTSGLARDEICPTLRAAGEILSPQLGSTIPDPVRRAAANDLLATKIPRGLRFNDRISMALSRELRVPFLDHRLVEFGFSVPVDEHLKGRQTKSLFREIAETWIPADLARAPKRSVQSPQREWLAGPWRPLVEDILLSKSFADREWINPAGAQSAYQAYCASPAENSFFIWQWLNLELWAREFLD